MAEGSNLRSLLLLFPDEACLSDDSIPHAASPPMAIVSTNGLKAALGDILETFRLLDFNFINCRSQILIMKKSNLFIFVPEYL